MTDNDWDAYSLEDCIILNSGDITPSEHLLSLHPSGFWISDVSQMEQISNSVESIMIQEGVGKEEGRFILSNLPSLISIQLYRTAFETCDSITFESKNDWVNDEWDLIRLQSIKLGYGALKGGSHFGFGFGFALADSNELIMKSISDNDDWLIRSSFSDSIQRRWIAFLLYKESDIGEWWLMIVSEIDIPSLTDEGIQLNSAFNDVQELNSSSMIDWLIMIEMLILLINSFDSIVG